MFPSSIEPEGLSVSEACAKIGVGRTKLYEAISSGQLVARKFGKRRILLVKDVRDFLSKLPIDTPPMDRSTTESKG